MGFGPVIGRLMPSLAAAGVGVQVGATTVASRFALGELEPATLAFLRYAIGVVCLAPLLLRRGLPRFAKADLLPICLLGIGQFAVLIALLHLGLRHLAAGPAAMLFATLPLMTMLLAALAGRERLNVVRSLGVLLTVLGVCLALAQQAGGQAVGGDVGLGAVLVLLSALTGAVCSVFYRTYLERYPALPTSFLAMLASVAALLPAALAEGLAVGPFLPSGAVVLAVLFVGVSSAIGYWLWLWALARASATGVTVFLALGPITATFLGAALLAEPLTWLTVAGVLAVAIGLVLAHRWDRVRGSVRPSI